MRAGLSTVRITGTILLFAGCSSGRAEDSTPLHQADATLPRLMEESQEADDVAMVSDFDAVADTLWILEQGVELNRYERRGDTWRRVATLTREGSGPGELRAAWGVAATPDGIAVTDAARVHYFTRAGIHARTTPLGLPCVMMQPKLAWSDAGVYLYGNCRRAGFRADTMKSILALARDTLNWQLVAEDVQYVTDGSHGSVFGPSVAFTPGVSHHLFGTAADDCVLRIHADGTAADRRCGLGTRRYRAPPPPSVAARMGNGTVRGIRVDWPDPLPAYMDRLITPAGDVVLRPYSADSLLVQRVDGAYEDLGVLPFNTLVGCKAAGCLWVDEDDVTRILLLRPAQVAALMEVPRAH